MKIVCASQTIRFNSRYFSKSFSYIGCLGYYYWITSVNAYNLLAFAVWLYMMQERRNEKIGILILFIIDQRDLAGDKAACVSRRCIGGSLCRHQCALAARAACIVCICLSEEGDLALYQTHVHSTAWTEFLGTSVIVDPFATQLWAMLPNARGPLQQGSAEICLWRWPPPSPGLGT